MKWRKFHELEPWDERRIFRLREGAKMRGDHSPEEWRRILANHKSAPEAPGLTISLADEAILLHPEGEPGQLELGAIVSALQHFRVTNGDVTIDPLLPFRLFPIIGFDAFTKGNSWRRQLWSIPLEIGREGQRYQRGWEFWRGKLRTELANEPDRTFRASELDEMSRFAIAETLEKKEKHDFLFATR